MNVSVELIHKLGPFQPKKYAVKAVEQVPHDLLWDIMNNPQKNRACIADHIKDMSYDEDTKLDGVLVLHDGFSQDALVINSSGYEYCREAAFIPGFMTTVKQEIRFEMDDMIEDEIAVYTHSPENEEPHQPFISWDKINERLGFAVTRENGLRATAISAVMSIPSLKGLDVTDNGIEFDIYIGGGIDVDEQNQQMGSVQL